MPNNEKAMTLTQEQRAQLQVLQDQVEAAVTTAAEAYGPAMHPNRPLRWAAWIQIQQHKARR